MSNNTSIGVYRCIIQTLKLTKEFRLTQYTKALYLYGDKSTGVNTKLLVITIFN